MFLEVVKNIKNKEMFIYLILLSMSVAIGFQGWSTLIVNFSIDAVGLTPAQNGLLQSVRELPGLLTVGVVLLLLFVKEEKLVFFAALISAIGVSLTGYFPTLSGLIITCLIASFGFHYFEGTNQSLTLQYFSKTEAPIVMGLLRSANACGNFVVGLCIFIAGDFFSYKQNFHLAGGLALIGIAVAFYFRPKTVVALPVQRRGVVIKARYWLFYLLTICSGARRQMFVVFSLLLLVKNFNFTVRDIALLFLINNLINWFLNPLVGRMINSIGERKLLTIKYVCLSLIFFAYTEISNIWIIVALYISEQFFFNFTLNIRTYFQKIAHPEDIAPTMSFSVTLNHIAAVIVPFVGGMLWMYDFRLPFYMGVGFAIASLILTQFMRIPDAD
ncbi:MFS transporter [Desulfovibrio litoralis]|uniref:Major Facilitator Superfamily protein n=1 Tax=Desulfovibrio litoralis DSM 11393 TaxID=1121455 RepID=A0A1M7S6D4_9BACT|nr:MFS transporter [Desulfovibrio litoralis]SHN54239.1 Major Facilitator Superfamily protein [Desulfovibrio litoralis DSM 11393]